MGVGRRRALKQLLSRLAKTNYHIFSLPLNIYIDIGWEKRISTFKVKGNVKMFKQTLSTLLLVRVQNDN